jgi:hypothetical protein
MWFRVLDRKLQAIQGVTKARIGPRGTTFVHGLFKFKAVRTANHILPPPASRMLTVKSCQILNARDVGVFQSECDSGGGSRFLTGAGAGLSDPAKW